MTIKEYQHAVDRWITTVGARYFPPTTNALLLAEETGEVARVVARTSGEQRAKPGERLDLADELADVMWVVAALANQHGIDLTEAAARNFDKKNRRDSQRFAPTPDND